MNNFDKINFNWNNVKNWWDKINVNETLFNTKFLVKKTENEKNIFKIKFLYILKQIFEIDNLDNINKIIFDNHTQAFDLFQNINDSDKSINYYIDSKKIFNNILKKKNLFNLLIQDDNKLKEIYMYLFENKELLKLTIEKILDIIKPLFEETFFEKIINTDDDLTRIILPIICSFIYLYIINNNLENIIKIFLNLDYTYMQFFIVSYLIIDNIMDNNKILDSDKKKFMKWFMNIVLNPENNILLPIDEGDNIWRYILFKKYFKKFIKKYPVKQFSIIYDFVKIMIDILNIANKIQRDKNSSEEQILEYSFKKSYVVCFFIALLINTELNKTFDDSHILQLSKLVFLIQLYDDILDIEKDISENNYTYFIVSSDGSSSDGSSLDGSSSDGSSSDGLPNRSSNEFETRVKKLIYATYDFLNSFGINQSFMVPVILDKSNDITYKQALIEVSENIDNKIINNIVCYFLENSLLLILNFVRDKIDDNLLDNFFEYSLLSNDCIKYFDKNSYNQFNSNILIKILIEILHYNKIIRNIPIYSSLY
jgi:hypothetical protein